MSRQEKKNVQRCKEILKEIACLAKEFSSTYDLVKKTENQIIIGGLAVGVYSPANDIDTSFMTGRQTVVLGLVKTQMSRLKKVLI